MVLKKENSKKTPCHSSKLGNQFLKIIVWEMSSKRMTFRTKVILSKW
jgi:hypothetical protein